MVSTARLALPQNVSQVFTRRHGLTPQTCIFTGTVLKASNIAKLNRFPWNEIFFGGGGIACLKVIVSVTTDGNFTRLFKVVRQNKEEESDTLAILIKVPNMCVHGAVATAKLNP